MDKTVGKARVLYISYDGMTDPLGQSQVIPYLKGLSEKGLRFTLLSCEKPDDYNQHKARIANLLAESAIEWVPLAYHKSPKVISTLWDVAMMWQTAKRLHHINRYDAVHCRSYIASLIGLEMQQRFGVKFIFDMRGFWADERRDAGLWPDDNLIYRWAYQYFKKKETEFIKKADAIVSLTHNAEQTMQAWSHDGRQRPLPIWVIPCCSDLSHFNPDTLDAALRENLASELGIQPQDYVLSYLGSLGTWYMLEEMLDFFVRLLQHRPKAKFLFITGDEHARIRQKAEARGIPPRQIVIRKGTRAEVPALISLSQASIFFIPTYFSKRASSPTKMGELLSMGVPLILNADVGDSNWLLSKYPVGLMINAFASEEYDRVLASLPELEKMKPATMRAAAADYFSLELGVRTYSQVYASLMQCSGQASYSSQAINPTNRLANLSCWL